MLLVIAPCKHHEFLITMNNHTIVRALFRAVKVETAQPPYDTIHLKVTYPAKLSGSELEQNMGIVPANSELAPFPVVIFLGGVNCGAEQYQWLAEQLANRGIVTVTFNWVAEDIPGMIGLSPGANVAMWAPQTYGTAPTASALPGLLAELRRLNAEGVLADTLDLQHVVLGGHSAGGRLAIENANPQFFPEVAAAFAYAAHTAAPVMMGYEPKTILPLPSALPLLLMGGTCDGVIANSSDRYGMEHQATTAVLRTFQEAITCDRSDNYLVLLEGANHFSMTDFPDSSAGRSFLDFPATQPEDQVRALIAEAIGLFIDAYIRQRPEALQALNQLLTPNHPLIQTAERK